MSVLHLDIETASEADLKAVGTYNYFAHESTRLLCAAFAFDDEEPFIIKPHGFLGDRILAHLENGGELVAWNANFERVGWNNMLTQAYGWPDVALEQWTCAMAEALAMNLPGSLDACAPVLGIKTVKDKDGYSLMMRMTKPLPLNQQKNGVKWKDDAASLDRLAEYCKQDVRVEQAIRKRTLRLRPAEKKLWWFDQQINDRGIMIDLPLARSIAKTGKKIADDQMDAIVGATGGEVASARAIGQMIKWLATQGVVTDSVDKESVTNLLKRDDLAEDVRAVLMARAAGSKSSIAKTEAMENLAGWDHRARGNLQYHAAGTGRWGGRGIQLQNLPRPALLKSETDLRLAMGAIQYENPDMLAMLYGDPATVLSDSLRSCIVAAPFKKFYVSDFSNIEGRITAWVGNEAWKLQAFRDYDAGTGEDIYLLSASGIYGVPAKEAKPFRQVGKCAELALGFQGGVGAFAKMAGTYGLKIETLYEGIWERADEWIREKATAGWAWRGARTGLTETGFLAAEAIKLAWRAKHPHIVAAWAALEEAARAAFDNPGQMFKAGRIGYIVNGSFLWCKLPSGRAICYPFPFLQPMAEVRTPDGETERMPLAQAQASGLEIVRESAAALTYMGVDSTTKQWRKKLFYGGLAMENVAQAVARDRMAASMIIVETSGYPVVLTIHDEVVAETSHNFGNLEHFNNLMATPCYWDDGLPVAVSGWEGERYRKG